MIPYCRRKVHQYKYGTISWEVCQLDFLSHCSDAPYKAKMLLINTMDYKSNLRKTEELRNQWPIVVNAIAEWQLIISYDQSTDIYFGPNKTLNNIIILTVTLLTYTETPNHGPNAHRASNKTNIGWWNIVRHSAQMTCIFQVQSWAAIGAGVKAEALMFILKDFPIFRTFHGRLFPMSREYIKLFANA